MLLKTEKNDKLKKAPKKNRWKIMLAIFFFFLIPAAILAWLKLQEPVVSQNIRVIDPAAEGKKAEIVKEKFEGKYLSFARPESFKLKNYEGSDNREKILETAFLAEEGVNSKKIALTVEKTRGNLEENSSYKMRQVYSDKYEKGRFQGGAVKAEVFTSKDAGYFEKVYFIIQEEKLAVLAFSASYPADPELEKEADEIAGSVIWR